MSTERPTVECYPFNHFDIDTKRRDYEWSMSSLHYHASYEIYYLFEGTRKILVQDRIYEILPGDIVMFKPNVFHRSMSTGVHTRYNVEFTDSFLCEYFTAVTREQLLKCFDREWIRLTEAENKEFYRLLSVLQAEYNGNGLFYITLAEMLKLLCEAADRPELENANKEEHLSKATQKIQPVLSYISRNYADIAAIDEIADACYINKSYMCRLFKKEMGITVVDYLNNIKLQQACELLRTTEDSLTEVALRCGFSGTSYFGQQFKKSMGCTPSAFRRNKR